MTTKITAIPTKPRRTAKLYRIPRPIDHTAPKAKRKGKARMVTGWTFSYWLPVNHGTNGCQACVSRLRAREYRKHLIRYCQAKVGAITRVYFPAPAGKGGGA